MLERACRCLSSLLCSRPRHYLCNPPPAKGLSTIRQSLHFFGSRRTAADHGMVQKKPPTAASRISRSNRIQKFGHRFAPSAGFVPLKSAAINRFRPDKQRLFFPARRHNILFFRRPGREPYAAVHGCWAVWRKTSREACSSKNDFVIFDEAHTMENVASRHIGVSLSSGQMRYNLQRLYNPRTEKGLLAAAAAGSQPQTGRRTAERSDDEFFAKVETACDELHEETRRNANGPESKSRRTWTELRIRRPEFCELTTSACDPALARDRQ